MSIENLHIIQEMARKIHPFNHPSIDPSKTEVNVLPAQQSVVLEVRLYSPDGQSVVQDLPLGKRFSIPGMQISVYPYSKRIHIENCYVRPEYHGRKLGTTFVRHLLGAAHEVHIKTASLVADTETDAAPYWRRVHQFQVADPNHPQYLERRL